MRTSALLAAALAVLALTGCQTGDPTIVPQPEPSSTPLFASEEEALAAAEEAFAAYLAVLDLISGEGGSAPERLTSVATPAVVEHETAGFLEMQASGEHTVGSRSFDSMTLQSTDPTSRDTTVVTYACQDFGNIDVLDSRGSSVLSGNRQLRYPLVISFDTRADDSLWVADVDDWTGEDFCVR